MRKLLKSMKTLLIAAGLLVGTNSAWAETETFGENKATTSKDVAIDGTAVSIVSTSNPSGKGNYSVFNSKADKGLKLRTSSSLILNVNDGYKVTNVTVYAYQNNTTSGTITCDSYTIDGGTTTAFDPTVSIPLNEEDASKQTLATISTGDISAKTSIQFNFTNTDVSQKQIYAFIEVTYESPYYGTLVHTASSNSDSNNTFSSSVDATTEKYWNETGSANKGFAFAEFSYTIPTGKYVKSATLTWSATNLNTNGGRTTKIYYLNAGKTIDYETLTSSPSELRFNNEKTWIKDLATGKGVSAISDNTDVTAAVVAMANQGSIIFQWTGIAGGANLNGKGAAESSRPKLLIETADLPIAEGDYYLKNKATGAYFAAGKSWGTQAITNDLGHYITLNGQPDGKYYVDTHITGDSHYLTQWMWVDNTADAFTIADAGEGYYTISYGDNKVTAGTVGDVLTLTDGDGDNTKWQLLTPAQWKAENVARLDNATSTSGVDATFYITAPNFNRNDDLNSAWQGSPSINGLGDVACNFNAEKYTDPYATFDVYQELTDLKPGIYKLTMQGFYRNGLNNASGANDNLAMLYANNVTVPLVNINENAFADNTHSAEGFTTAKSGYYVPNSQTDASLAFNAGYYNNELFVLVGNDGALRLGVKKTAETGTNADWTVLDNFQLTYYGTSITAEITAAGWATLYTDYALDFSGVEGLEAYTATLSESTVTLTKVDNIPANTGVVLKGNANTYSIPVIASSETPRGDLKGSTTEAKAASEQSPIYILKLNNNEAQFMRATYGSLDAGKAYLEIANGGQEAKALTVVFANDPTGISNVNAAETVQPVKRIVNGQLVIEKNGKRYNAAGAEF